MIDRASLRCPRNGENESRATVRLYRSSREAGLLEATA